MIWKNRIKRVAIYFYVDFNPINTKDILDVHKYLKKRKWYKIMFGLIKKRFIGSLTDIVSASNHTKCASLTNQTQLSLTNLHCNEHSQEFHYYPFVVKLDRC